MANYKKVSDNVVELVINNPKTTQQLLWINIINAGKREISYLRKNYKFDLAHLKAAYASTSFQRPIIFRGNGYLCLILHFPTFREERIVAEEIDFFIGHGFLVTAHSNNLRVLKNFFKLGQKSSDSLLAYSLESSAILLYEILDRLIDSCFQLLDKNSLKINEIENLIFSDKQQEAVRKILTLRRNIVNFRKIIQNHKNVLQKLLEMESSLVEKKAIKKYYSKLVENSKRIWETLDNQKEMVEVLNNTNESILNDRMSDIMKTLTIFSVIVFPLNLLAAIFGMNAKGMPLVDSEHGFWIIVGLMSIASFFMLVIFAKKKWL